MVSVIVPVYNVEKYLEDCLTSVEKQTYRDIEIILIDDGSTDCSGKICDKHAKNDHRIRVIHKKNEGVSIARNTGIKHATGEYLMFVDSDDCIHPKIVENYLKLQNSGVTVICDLTDDYDRWKNFKGSDFEVKTENISREYFMKMFYEDHINSPADKLYCTDIIKKNGILFPTDKNLGEDLLFNLEYLMAAKTSYVIMHGPYYYYRFREGSLTHLNRSDLIEIQKNLFKEIRRFLESSDLWSDENEKMYYSILWDRLYLNWKLLDKRRECLKDPVWDEVWRECQCRGVCTWKRKMKRIITKMYRYFL